MAAISRISTCICTFKTKKWKKKKLEEERRRSRADESVLLLAAHPLAKKNQVANP